MLGLVAEAIDTGELRPDADPEDIAFTLIALLENANPQALLFDDDTPYDRAHRAVLRRLRSDATDPDGPAFTA